VAKRDGSEKSLNVDLANHWRAKADISRRVGTGGLRGLATGGLVLGESSHCRSVFRNVLSFDGHIFLAKAGVIIY
jgi:hypothetical protein